MDILSTPVYYISFKKEESLEKDLKNAGFNNVHHFSAVDGRKMNPYELLDQKKITIRTFNDLKTTRRQHTGIPSLGAIGCTMSHSKLWKHCIDQDLPYMIIAEGDLKLKQKISKDHLKKIQNILQKEKSIYISPHSFGQIQKTNITRFSGLHFYIVSQSACKELVQNVYPIDVQTDHYIAHLDTLKKVYVDGFPISSQNIHFSSIQDICIKCMLPNEFQAYIAFFVLLFFLFRLNKL